MEGERGVTGSVIDELLSWDLQGDQRVKVVLLEVLLMLFILPISNEVKRKVKVVLLQV